MDYYYYASMLKKATQIILICLVLGACSNREPTVVKTAEPQRLPTPTTIPTRTTLPSSASGTTTTTSTTSSPSVYSQNPVQNNQVVTAPSPQPIIVAEVDLLERMRRGFRIPNLNSDLTANHLKWSVEHPTYLTDLINRAEPFLWYLIEELEKRDLPMELALIPVIESAYKPNALSRSNASGLWQFIPSTGRGFGLRQDSWYDGRRDFLESTNAALDYFTQLNAMFNGDWFHTLAAYNAGQGTLLRAIQANQRNDRSTHYQALNLREETRQYVPKLQAIKNIVARPWQYNVTLPTKTDQPYFAIVDIPGQLDLQAFSHLSGLELDEVKHLNAGFLRWATPPEGPHRLLLPINRLARAESALAQIAAQPNTQHQRHQIAQGETLSTISNRYGVSVASLQSLNKLSGTSIKAGRTLLIPLGARGARTSNTVTSQTSETGGSSNQFIHKVVAGDTLWSISQRYKVAVNQLRRWNKLASDHILQLNQALLIFSN